MNPYIPTFRDLVHVVIWIAWLNAGVLAFLAASELAYRIRTRISRAVNKACRTSVVVRADFSQRRRRQAWHL